MRRNVRNWRIEELEVGARDIPTPEGGQNNRAEAHSDQALVRARLRRAY
jgi:hypothetical protein